SPGNDRRFPLSNMEALLRYGETGTHALTSDLFRLCPDSLRDTRTRNLVTTASYDFNRPGFSPWVVRPNPPIVTAPDWSDSYYQPLRLADGTVFPTGAPTPFLDPGYRSRVLPQGSEFSPSWQAIWRTILPRLYRLDLNRSLPNYPPAENPVS